jgi:hypothetical protein
LSPSGTLLVPAAPAEPLTIELVRTVWRMPAYRRAPRPRTALHAPSVDLFDSFAT